jgi:hypothetical protein
MGFGIVYDILGVLVIVLFLASRLDKQRYRSRALLLIAIALLAGGVISWCLETLQALSFD